MLINGQPVLTTNIKSIVEQIMKLPSGVVRTGVSDEQVHHGYPLSQLHMNAEKHVVAGFKARDVEHFNRACVHLNAGLGIAIKMGNEQGIAHFNFMLAEVSGLRGDDKATLGFYKDTIKVARNADMRALASDCAGRLYKAHLMNTNYEKNSFADVQDELTLCKETIASIITKGRRFETVDDDAYLLVQREYGISNKERIGTLGVGDCGILVLRDPHTHWTSLAHIDRYVHSKNIAAVLEGQVDGPSMPLLTASLCGMGIVDGNLIYGAETQNLEKIIEFLLPRNINVVSANIFDPDPIEAFVVDPETGSITEALGQKRMADTVLQFGAMKFICDSQYLIKAFNLVESKTVKPVYITSDQAHRLVVDTERNNERELFEYYMEGFPAGASQHGANAVYEQQATYRANEKASLAIIDRVDSMIDKVAKLDISIGSDQHKALHKAIRMTAKYIGGGADEANKPKVDFVCSEIVQSCQHGGTVRCDFDRIAKFSFG